MYHGSAVRPWIMAKSLLIAWPNRPVPTNQFGQQFGQTSRFGHRNLANRQVIVVKLYFKTTVPARY